MKINTLLIKNFRGIQSVEARNLGDTIIIAGQNGSGKGIKPAGMKKVIDAIKNDDIPKHKYEPIAAE